ncbi:hypothetical protein ECL_B035 (plasmid) [Enterobacter cloacae subsp. cloacae ATCC 13047]|uniref:Uncharacterized protein n=1 Tax=Enterobacter cloacae subsp. cloacae (strain ATCC 13047 / DSM 30054 / NBRC 13535 / NCTC 10005 / WDCM 00083 / NCDC 279-56) TaxID=716541 RepID=A0A0H3CTV6_ENTCC|nr:hypothetical protein ECL_B035 [Enterobacter cloacae subsp. cloacae ATCC 13047]
MAVKEANTGIHRDSYITNKRLVHKIQRKLTITIPDERRDDVIGSRLNCTYNIVCKRRRTSTVKFTLRPIQRMPFIVESQEATQRAERNLHDNNALITLKTNYTRIVKANGFRC